MNPQHSDNNPTHETQSPWASPTTATPVGEVQIKPVVQGIHRLSFFLASIGTILVTNLIAYFSPLFIPSTSLETLEFILQAAWVFSLFLLCYYRLKNVGYNPKLAALLIIPFANLWVILACLTCQEDYVKAGKYDRIGLAIFVIVIFHLITMLMFFAWLITNMGH